MARAAYNVGGVVSSRPFRLRRLGHMAFDIDKMSATLDFFARDLGLHVSDILDLRQHPDFAEAASKLDDPRVIFLTTGHDHHSVVLIPRPLAVAFRGPQVPADIQNAHISFQLSGADEVVAAKGFLEENGTAIQRIDRDFPGSNWHCYFQTPDGLPVEFYYGMEQLGWQRRSKPTSLYGAIVKDGFAVPINSEASELEEYLQSGAPIDPPVFTAEPIGQKEVVGGVLLERPFRVTRIGPVSYFVDDVQSSTLFFTEMLGMIETERASFRDGECVFLRNGTEHHSVALYSEQLRKEAGLPKGNRHFALGLQVGSYDQLRRGGLFLIERGWRQTQDIPHGFYTGIDRALFFEDPQGHRIMLYYYMEQIGWDGRPRPADLRGLSETRPVKDWPEIIEAPTDVYADQPLVGPLG